MTVGKIKNASKIAQGNLAVVLRSPHGQDRQAD